MSKEFLAAVEGRRSYYSISKESRISDSQIQEIIEKGVKHSPSPFNAQSGKVVVLLGKEHDKLWNIVKESLRKVVPAEQFSATEEKINGFANGYGSVLYFDDSAIIHGLQEQFPLYKDNFAVWSQQANGMIQFVIWTALEKEGLGASLQHYNELIEDEVKKVWNIPESWSLTAQMPFGKPTAAPGEKDFHPIENRVKVYQS